MSYNLVDLSKQQAYSPRHAFLRFRVSGQPTLGPSEFDAIQLANAYIEQQESNHATFGSFETDISQWNGVPNNLFRDEPTPILRTGYAVSYGTDSGSGTYFAETVNYERAAITFDPVNPLLRGVVAQLVIITGHSNPIYNGTQILEWYVRDTAGAQVDAFSDLSPLNGAAPSGYVNQTTIRATYYLDETDPTACEPAAKPYLGFKQGDLVMFPIYMYRNDASAIAALSFVLENQDTAAIVTLPTQQQISRLTGIASIYRDFNYAGSLNSVYDVYSFNVPSTLPDGCYRLLVTVDGAQYQSIVFNVASTCLSRLFRYRSADTQMDFVYDNAGNELTNNWNQLRLPINLKDYASTHERSSYIRSDGRTIKLQERIGKQYTLETDYLPEPIHEALALALAHDYVELYDDRTQQWLPYVLSGDYRIEWPDNQYHLAPATAEITLAQYQINNAYC